jgi:hypothetical protein
MLARAVLDDPNWLYHAAKALERRRLMRAGFAAKFD